MSTFLISRSIMLQRITDAIESYDTEIIGTPVHSVLPVRAQGSRSSIPQPVFIHKQVMKHSSQRCITRARSVLHVPGVYYVQCDTLWHRVTSATTGCSSCGYTTLRVGTRTASATTTLIIAKRRSFISWRPASFCALFPERHARLRAYNCSKTRIVEIRPCVPNWKDSLFFFTFL